MKNFPKTNIFHEPPGYFDRLPDEILARKDRKSRQVFLTRMVAAAAVLLMGLAVVFNIFWSDPQTSNYAEAVDTEVEIYISSGYWQAEDILLMSENPDEILDEIIASEWVAFYPENDFPEEEWWF
jgi:hypothetical protein